jgi:hypothetical protein
VDIKLVSFGRLRIDGRDVDHDIVIEDGRIRRRRKGPSKRYRDRYGHTPLSIDEGVPWSAPRLIVGTGQSGNLPIMPKVIEEAQRRKVELIALPTAKACRFLREADLREVNAVLHVTC